ncbi:hypothetical protein DFJ73DRAFT_580679 [Zopfochytrium polystomum]|nr:hypothetical protein DFJ73DRAFT_580679 [Zopfochytrium polystomum]
MFWESLRLGGVWISLLLFPLVGNKTTLASLYGPARTHLLPPTASPCECRQPSPYSTPPLPESSFSVFALHLVQPRCGRIFSVPLCFVLILLFCFFVFFLKNLLRSPPILPENTLLTLTSLAVAFQLFERGVERDGKSGGVGIAPNHLNPRVAIPILGVGCPRCFVPGATPYLWLSLSILSPKQRKTTSSFFSPRLFASRTFDSEYFPLFSKIRCYEMVS